MKTLKIVLGVIASILSVFFLIPLFIFCFALIFAWLHIQINVYDWPIFIASAVVSVLVLWGLMKILRTEKILIYFLIFLILSLLGILAQARFKKHQGGYSNDTKRLFDVRMLAYALKLYKNDKAGYPVNLSELTPVYTAVIPEPHTLIKGGACEPRQNIYKYEKVSQEDYKLTFCFEYPTAEYKEGVHILTPKGIQ